MASGCALCSDTKTFRRYSSEGVRDLALDVCKELEEELIEKVEFELVCCLYSSNSCKVTDHASLLILLQGVRTPHDFLQCKENIHYKGENIFCKRMRNILLPSLPLSSSPSLFPED